MPYQIRAERELERYVLWSKRSELDLKGDRLGKEYVFVDHGFFSLHPTYTTPMVIAFNQWFFFGIFLIWWRSSYNALFVCKSPRNLHVSIFAY